MCIGIRIMRESCSGSAAPVSEVKPTHCVSYRDQEKETMDCGVQKKAIVGGEEGVRDELLRV